MKIQGHAILLAALVTLAGCASGGGLERAATRLDNSAQRFYEESYAGGERRHATDDAAALAEATRDFRREVERMRSREALARSFERVSDRYHHLRGRVGRPDSRYRDGTLAFERVTEAYLDVDRALNHADSRAHR